MVGGAAVTEEFHPGLPQFGRELHRQPAQPKVIADLELHEHGLRIVERRAHNFCPRRDGRYLLAGEGRTRSRDRELARAMPRARRLHARLEAVADVLRDSCCKAPPNVGEGFRSGRSREACSTAARPRPAACTGFDCRSSARCSTCSPVRPASILDSWFESELVKARSGSTPWSATTPAPTRRARPTCCCTTCSAR